MDRKGELEDDDGKEKANYLGGREFNPPCIYFHERKLNRYTGPYRDPNRLKSPCPSQLSKPISAKMAHNMSTVSQEQ